MTDEFNSLSQEQEEIILAILDATPSTDALAVLERRLRQGERGVFGDVILTHFQAGYIADQIAQLCNVDEHNNSRVVKKAR